MTSPVSDYFCSSVSDIFEFDSDERSGSFVVTSSVMSSDGTTVGVDGVEQVEPQNHEQRKRLYGPRSDALAVLPDVDLTGKTYLITGTTAGIGTETARALALKNAHVVMANRNLLLSEELKKKIVAEKPDAKVDIISCDLSSLQSVQAAAKEFKEKHWPLHGLILNAGVFAPTQKMTFDNLETCFGINHVGHFYLIRELLPVLQQTDNSRIVIVSSHSHNHTGLTKDMTTEQRLTRICPKDDSDNLYRRYAYSKFCNVLTAFKLHRQEHQHGISVYVVHPGTMIGTDISRGFGVMGRFFNFLSKPFTKTLSQGAATTVYCAASPEVTHVSGKYWESCWDDEKQLDVEFAHDVALQDALWTYTNELIDNFEAKRQNIAVITPSNGTASEHL